ncbi:hypothetical protein KHQ81_09010 [Mycoplasmatota bacterium]|nr:hypothetical protein KHQ81_09010 [Mycoplasmatota bacterium]
MLKNIKYVGHRGSRGVGVENTIEAFQEGIKRGYFALECDIRVTKDNQFVVIHDETLERLAPNDPLNSFQITELTYEQLKQVTLTQTYQGRILTGKIPLLKEYLKLCKQNNIIPVIELKWSTGINDNDNSNVSNLIQLIKDEGMYNNCVILTSMKNTIKYIRDHYQDISLQLLIGGNSKISDEILKFAVLNRLSVDIEKNVLTKEIIDFIHANKLLVNVWVVNEINQAKQFSSWGVDMITTDVLN